MALLITPDGNRRYVNPADRAEGFTLAELYALLGCETVETITLASGDWLVMDEDGKERRPGEHNAEATKLLHLAGGMPQDYVTGPVLMCSRRELQ